MKVVACFGPGIDDHAAVAERMAQAQSHAPQQRCRVFPVAGGALGCVSGPEQVSPISLARTGPRGNLLLISGVPIDLHGPLDRRLDDILASDHQRAAELLSQLDGAFAALFWDAANRKLVAVTDALGIQPLHIARPDGALLLATELKALPASGQLAVELEPAGWGAFLSLGFNIGDRTQLAGAQLVGTATCIVHDPAGGSTDSATYWSLPKPRPEMGLDDVDTTEMLRILRLEIERYLSHCRSTTCLLSGGFDSRLILAMLADIGADCRVVSLAHPEQGFGVDGAYAARVARALGIRDFTRVLPARDFYLSPAYLRYLVLDEVAIPSVRLYISTHVWSNLRPEMMAVWDGLGPGFAFAPGYPLPGGFSVYLRDRCKDRDSPLWQAALRVFSDAMGCAMYDDFRRLLDQETSRFPDDDFGTGRFQMATQMRRFLGPSPMTVYANEVLPLTPALSKDLWNLAGAVPLSVTADKKLYFRVFERHFPKLARVPFCSGGKLLSHKAHCPALWARTQTDHGYRWLRYHLRRLPRLPVAGPALGKLGLIPKPAEERNHLLDAVVGCAEADHPDLDGDTVRRLQEAKPPYSWPTRLGRHILFYWQAWRWIMSGELTAANAESLLEDRIAQLSRGARS